MDKITIKNAEIEGTFLGVEDHGILTAILYLDYGGSGQGFGTYSLDTYDKEKGVRIGTDWGMEFIRKVLEVLEVNSWEDLKGVNIRVKSDYGKVHSIGHILKNQWFSPGEDLKYLLKGNNE